MGVSFDPLNNSDSTNSDPINANILLMSDCGLFSQIQNMKRAVLLSYGLVLQALSQYSGRQFISKALVSLKHNPCRDLLSMLVKVCGCIGGGGVVL